jgi:peptidoglycan/xylan/chitin deacetylase (PgdA/CDA1 family)
MFRTKKLAGWFGVIAIGFVAVGCSGATDDEEATALDDGDSLSEELVSENQLGGRELPAKTVSLTFDDGPGDRTKELAEFLASKNIKATFFINGKNVPGRQKHLDAIIANGHLLANHTQNHLSLPGLTTSKVLDEVEETDVFLRQEQPRGPWLIRAPFGAWSGRVANGINGSEMKKYAGSIFWDIGGELTSTSAADWACWSQRVSSERCSDLYMQEAKARGRGIVLLHDSHPQTIDMVKKYLVPDLIAAHYKFVPITAVPSVKRAIAGAGADDGNDPCMSATLGRRVKENVCVQSTQNDRWYRCVDGEWLATQKSDTKCSARFPL